MVAASFSIVGYMVDARSEGTVFDLARTMANVVGGAKKFLGNSILLELLAQTLEEQCSAIVERRHHAADAAELFDIFLNQEIDFYPEYSGTLLAQHLRLAWHEVRDDRNHTEQRLNEYLRVAHQSPIGHMTGGLGHGTEVVLGMTKRRAEELGLLSGSGERPTISQLAEVSRRETITFRTTTNFFRRRDGYPALVKEYELRLSLDDSFADHDKIAFDLVNGRMDVADLYTTNFELLVYGDYLVVFADDRHFFPLYRCHPIISDRFLNTHPECVEAFQNLAGAVLEGDVQRMCLDARHRGLSTKRLATDKASIDVLAQIVSEFRTNKGL